jgi:hypothetical protein
MTVSGRELCAAARPAKTNLVTQIINAQKIRRNVNVFCEKGLYCFLINHDERPGSELLRVLNMLRYPYACKSQFSTRFFRGAGPGHRVFYQKAGLFRNSRSKYSGLRDGIRNCRFLPAGTGLY